MSVIGASPVAAAGWFRQRVDTMVHLLVPIWIFFGAVVITEPSPYELMFVIVLGTSLFGGIRLHRSTLGLLILFGLFVPFAYVAAFQVRYNPLIGSLIYQTVTIFLFFTSYWVANYVAEAPVERMKQIMGAYLLAALISAVFATIGYAGILHSLFTRYDRGKALFNDPNVYGPFLIPPAMFALQRLFLAPPKRAFWAAAAYALLFLGVLVSFSRAAWGHIVFSSIILFVLVFALEAKARLKARMLMLALVGLLAIIIGIAGAFSIPSVRSFIELRTEVQNYDTGESGRFGRQGYAFDLALTHPLGLGPLEFRNMRVKEEPHDTYVNVLHAYGWGGGFMLILFIFATIWRGVRFLAQPSPNRLLLIPLISVWVPLAGEAAIIDIDHWRHFFLIGGLIWGVTAAFGRKPAAGVSPLV